MVAGSTRLLSPADAYAEGLAYSVLNDEEVKNINAICSILVPGAEEAGVAHFIDHQLKADPNDSLLVLKYFGFPPPYVDFYRPVIAAIAELSRKMFNLELSGLDENQGRKLVESFRGENPEGSPWVKFNIRFYVIALIFLIFDVEIVLLFPWALTYKSFIAFKSDNCSRF